MADERSHLSWGFLLALGCSAFVFLSTKFDVELSLLAGALVMIGSILPNIDSTDEGITGELSGLLGALIPVIFIQQFPSLSSGGSVRIALTILGGYVAGRLLFSYFAEHIFTPRGALHSLPAIILFFEIGYIIFPDLYWRERFLLGMSLSIGVASHIFLDAFTNLSLVKKTLAKNAHEGSVIKFSGATVASTWFLYLSIIFLGWFVAKDISPSLKVQPPVTVDKK